MLDNIILITYEIMIILFIIATIATMLK